MGLEKLLELKLKHKIIEDEVAQGECKLSIEPGSISDSASGY